MLRTGLLHSDVSTVTAEPVELKAVVREQYSQRSPKERRAAAHSAAASDNAEDLARLPSAIQPKSLLLFLKERTSGCLAATLKRSRRSKQVRRFSTSEAVRGSTSSSPRRKSVQRAGPSAST